MKKLIVICLICALALSLVAVATTQNDDVVANASTNAPYALYPVPQQIEFGGGIYDLPRKVSVSFGSSLDTYTVNHAWQALSKMDLVGYSNRDDLSYKFYFGVYNSNDQADAYVQTLDLDIPQGMFDKIDAYLLHVGQNATVVLGKDTDATFFGISSLAMIFEQSTANKLYQTTIYDWADSIYRGFIEGYYGIPWTTDERVELMEFAQQFKANIYMYAPKDDPYHGTNWRGLYNETDLEEIKEQVEAGNRTKVRFTWAIHPLLANAMTPENYQEDLQVLLAKFEQLYSVGVRSFTISADDIYTGEVVDGVAPKYDATFQKNLLNDVSVWLRDKGDCTNLIFVPSAYNSEAGTSVYVDLEYYFNTLMGGVGSDGVDRGTTLDETVDIMWTGNYVCSSVSNGTFEQFSQLTGGRKAFMWMNWPVNDYATNTILMSKAEVYDVTDYAEGEIPFSGIVTNPMQYAEASKVGIFATADYCWNVNAFDVDKSYQDCFQYIEKNCPDELYNICLNIANAGHFEKHYFDESWIVQPVIEQFLTAYHANDQANAKVHASTLKTLFDQIIEDVDSYLATAQNQNFLANIRPFAEALKYKSISASEYVGMYANLDNLSKEEILQSMERANQGIVDADNCLTYVLDPVTQNHVLTPVSTCVAVINPFLRELEQYVKDDILLAAGAPTGNVYRGFNGIYQGAMENVTDGDASTYVWFQDPPQRGKAYVRIDYVTPQLITDIVVTTGNGVGNDVWKGIVQWSNDGISFTDIATFDGAQTVIDIRSFPVTARFLRLLDNSDPNGGNPELGSRWCALKEVQINSLPDNYVSTSGLSLYSDAIAGCESNLDNIVDDDVESIAWFDWHCPVGAYLQLNYKEIQSASFIRLLMGTATNNDHLTNVSFSYSLNGRDFTPIESKHFGKEIYIYLPQEIEFRHLRVTSNVVNELGVIVRDFSFDKTDGNSSLICTGFDGINQGSLQNINDGNPNTLVHFKNWPGENAFVIWDLGELTLINELSVYTGILNDNGVYGDTWPCFVEYSTDGVSYTRLGSCVDADTYFRQLEENPIEARYLKLVNNNAASWIAIREISVNYSYDYYRKDVTYNGLDSIYQGELGNLLDGKDDTHLWFVVGESGLDENSYITIDFGRPRDISDLTLLNGNTSGGDKWGLTVYYSLDGTFSSDNVFGEFGHELDTETIDRRLQPVQARYLRLVHKSRQAGYVALRELKINSLPELQGVVTYSGINGLHNNTDPASLIDGDDNTYVWFASPFTANSIVTIDYLDVKTIYDITLLNGLPEGGDTWGAYLYYSTDGVFNADNSYLLGEFVRPSDSSANNQCVIDLRHAPIRARYLHLVHNANYGYVALRELKLNTLPSINATISYAGFSGLHGGEVSHLLDGDENTFLWFEGRPTEQSSVTISYFEEQTIKNLTLLNGCIGDENTLGDFWGVKVYYSTDGVLTQDDQHFIGRFSATESSTIDIRYAPITTKYIHLVHESNVGFVALRELKLNTMPAIQGTVTYSGIPGGLAVGQQDADGNEIPVSLSYVTDGNEDTFAWFVAPAYGIEKKANVTIDYGKAQKISNVYLLTGKPNGDGTIGDYWVMTLEYSVDGVNFTKVEDFLFNEETTLHQFDAPVEARYIRLVHSGNDGWVAIRECTVNKQL